MKQRVSLKLEGFYITFQYIAWGLLALGLSTLIMNGVINLGVKGLLWLIGIFSFSLATISLGLNIFFFLLFLYFDVREDVDEKYKSYYRSPLLYIIVYLLYVHIIILEPLF